MRIHSNRKLFFELLAIAFVLLLSFLFLKFSRMIEFPVTSWIGAFLLSFLPAFFITSALGLALHEQSRKGSFFLFATFLPFLYTLSFYPGVLKTNGLLFGLLAGGLLDFRALYNNRFNTLTGYTRAGSRLFFFALAIYLFVQLLGLMSPLSIERVQQLFESGAEEPKNLGFALLVVLALLMSTKLISDIRISEVFVYGPSRSGKTLLLLALYNHFVNFYDGTHREIIISYDMQGNLSKVNENRLRIESMLAELEAGNMPKSTGRADMAMYELSGKKGAIPIEFSFVDYSGEYTEDLEPEKYASAVQNLTEKLERFNANTIYRQIGTISFLELLKKDYAKELRGEFHNLILASIYKKMETAGEIIFLVDGDYLLNYQQEGRKELTRLFGLYSRLIDILGSEKSYALVVTKIDKFKDLSEISEDSEAAQEIEQEVYDLMSKMDTFREIRHRAQKVPVYLYTVSVDATLPPQLSKEGMTVEGHQRVTQIYPWRVREIAQFGS
ncbi:hypothetical protein [Methanosarcina sp. 1.H.A.2.2]|uniref:hypothetical protein n=1 Tax=Methanosarcina sp. 1.H.A.2.2 TaxID=1483601 RepID=UPI0006215B86|nr:hypothetical protein [Methanosarcina sp. 1.H.A.2.2]KKH46959.1 hypothetical protein EO93_06550 [Methanosarcina sp. 1.H.A.2.2]